MSWRTATAHGRTFDTLKQSGSWACALCCSAMAINWTQGGRPSERSLISSSMDTATSDKYTPASEDRKDFKKTPMTVAMLSGANAQRRAQVLFGNDPGTGLYNVKTTLEGYRLNAALKMNPSKDELKAVLTHTSDDGKRPVIIGMNDPPHAIICHSYLSKVLKPNIYIFADPAEGDAIDVTLTESSGVAYVNSSRYTSTVLGYVALSLAASVSATAGGVKVM